MLLKMSRQSDAANRLESLEARTLFADIWGTAPSLMGIDDLANNYPLITGTGQTIAVIDTGIDYNHPNLGGGFGAGFKVVGGFDFADNDADPMDTDGHGTAVAGVLAASKFEVGGFTYRGVAPDASLVALRIAPNTTDVPLEKIELALNWVLAHVQEFNIGVVNLSFGFGRFDTFFSDQTLSEELQGLRAAGIAFVSSAGNGGTNDGFGITAPAADSSAFSVGSVNGSDVISEFSQRSSKLTLLAVGEGVRSTGLNGTFQTEDGTSFAAPAVAGTIALMRQVDTYTLGDIRSIFKVAMPKNYDGDQEIGVTTGFTFQRLDAARAIDVATLRKAGSTEVQAAIGVAGSENDLIYDDQGVLHFVYYDNNARTMKYAVKSTNGNWSAPSLIDAAIPNVGSEFSLKLDSYGAPKLAYLDSPNGDLKFARLNGTSWAIERLDTAGVTGLYPSLAIDENDQLWVSYLRKTNFDLRVMRFNGTEWSRQTIDSDGNVGYSSVITMDKDDRPAVAYANSTSKQLKIARLSETNTWEFDIADQGVLGAAYLSLAFDFENRPRISYYEVETADLKYAANTGVEWMVTRIASRGATGQYTNLRIDGENASSILYWDRRSNSLNRASAEGESWRITTVAPNAGKYLFATKSAFSNSYYTASNRDNKLVFIEAV